MLGNYISYKEQDFICGVCGSYCTRCLSNVNCQKCYQLEKVTIVRVEGLCKVQPTTGDDGDYDFSTIGDKFGDTELTELTTDIKEQFATYKQFELNIK